MALPRLGIATLTSSLALSACADAGTSAHRAPPAPRSSAPLSARWTDEALPVAATAPERAPLPAEPAPLSYVEPRPPLPPGAKAAGTSDADPLFRSLVGKTAPELAANGRWIREPSGTSLAALRGQVVLLQFTFVECGACALVAPHVRRWHESYGPSGLVVIDVDNGLMDPFDAARKALESKGMRYPVFHDSAGTTIRSYGVRAFPTAYLVGKDGNVLWEGNPMGSEPAVEAAIVKALE